MLLLGIFQDRYKVSCMRAEDMGDDCRAGEVVGKLLVFESISICMHCNP